MLVTSPWSSEHKICIVCSNVPGTNDEIGRPENETLLANDGEEGERNKLL